MLVIPAVDLRGGKCVRLYQGSPDQEMVFSEDPVEVAAVWRDKGAQFLHVVDLDGAFVGNPQNTDIVERIIAEVQIPVQVGGGIRSVEAAQRILDLGAARVILGTVAITEPSVIEECVGRFGDKVVVGIDVRRGKVAVEGWGTTVEKTAADLAREVKSLGVGRVVFTDTRRDGTLRGPNLEALRQLAEASGLRLILAGGVATVEDIRRAKQLEPLGLEAVILGRALYDGSITLAEALAAAADPGR
ncbi:MAG: 1-(5-phosphoribosyl)-5-[(5-phosphoribosylamino)methylideneamino]imidazole-4-carboxamide isomerase [Clostridia bacterium]|nr:1-(5-phosphoribosyl)-5-[(5-phosphoribosylamino)methylideneamino]imidazole-4-carboxamide isomerase [Clostridia bacterium]